MDNWSVDFNLCSSSVAASLSIHAEATSYGVPLFGQGAAGSSDISFTKVTADKSATMNNRKINKYEHHQFLLRILLFKILKYYSNFIINFEEFFEIVWLLEISDVVLLDAMRWGTPAMASSSSNSPRPSARCGSWGLRTCCNKSIANLLVKLPVKIEKCKQYQGIEKKKKRIRCNLEGMDVVAGERLVVSSLDSSSAILWWNCGTPSTFPFK